MYNVPNKAIEYLAAGLAVWYPAGMLSLRQFHEDHQEAALVELDFLALPVELPLRRGWPLSQTSRFCAEDVLGPLVDTLDRL